MKKLYITGPLKNYKPFAFSNIEELIKSKGFTCISCRELQSGEVRETRSKRITKMLECDAVITMEDWFEDDFCKLEVMICRQLKIPVHHFTIITSLEDVRNSNI